MNSDFSILVFYDDFYFYETLSFYSATIDTPLVPVTPIALPDLFPVVAALGDPAFNPFHGFPQSRTLENWVRDRALNHFLNALADYVDYLNSVDVRIVGLVDAPDVAALRNFPIRPHPWNPLLPGFN
jgi:hypothetical protein